MSILFTNTIPVWPHARAKFDGHLVLANATEKTMPVGTRFIWTEDTKMAWWNHEKMEVRRLIVEATGEDFWFSNMNWFEGIDLPRPKNDQTIWFKRA